MSRHRGRGIDQPPASERRPRPDSTTVIFGDAEALSLCCRSTTIPKTGLKQRWAQQFADDNQIPPRSQPTPYATNPPTTRQITKALNALNKLAVIQHDRHHITIIDHALLVRIANLA